MTKAERDRDELAEHLAQVFRDRYAEVVEEEGPERAFEIARAAMEEAMRASKRRPD